MTLSTSVTQLNSALKALRLRWQQASLHWNDPVQRDFEEKFYNLLEEHVQATVQAMDRLDKLLFQVQQDCS